MRFPVFIRSPGARLTFLLTLACAAAGRAGEPTPTPAAWESKAWRRVADLLVDDAVAGLPRPGSGAAERRELDFARGVMLLNAQPKYQANIDTARGLLESVRQTRPDDDTGLGALYYLARIAQYHDAQRDPARAAALYAELIGRAPGHPLAEEAVSRLAVLRLYDETISPQERQARLAGFEADAERLRTPGARRDLHFVLADARGLLADDREGELRDLLAVEEAGIVRQQLAADVLVRVAVLARSLGQRDVAIAHYKKFLASFERDGRAYMLAEQLKTLEAQAAPATAPPAP